MERIRILVGEIPQEFGDNFKRAVTDQPDMELVGEVRNGVELLLAAGRKHADIVIIGLQNSDPPGIYSHLLDEYPHIKVLAVAPDGHRACLFELRPQKFSIGEASVDRLLAVIRAAAQNGGA